MRCEITRVLLRLSALQLRRTRFPPSAARRRQNQGARGPACRVASLNMNPSERKTLVYSIMLRVRQSFNLATLNNHVSLRRTSEYSLSYNNTHSINLKHENRATKHSPDIYFMSPYKESRAALTSTRWNCQYCHMPLDLQTPSLRQHTPHDPSDPLK